MSLTGRVISGECLSWTQFYNTGKVNRALGGFAGMRHRVLSMVLSL